MIYIQCNYGQTIPSIFDSACALYGGVETGDISLTDVNYIAYDTLHLLDKDIVKKHLFVGSTQFMERVFSIMGYNENEIPRVKENSNRKSDIMKLGDALELSYIKRIFVKPVKIKLFTGLALNNDWDRISLYGFDKDTEVFVYDTIDDIRAEYRAYIKDGKVVGVKDYSGDNRNFPCDYTYLDNIVSKNLLSGDFPVAYTIDIGICGDNTPFVVEFNDMWAIGNYGLENEVYYKMLRQRYFEIVRGSLFK